MSDHELSVPRYVVLERNQSEEPCVPRLLACFSDPEHAVAYTSCVLNRERKLEPPEMITVEHVLDDGAEVLFAMTSKGFRMIITDDGPRSAPSEIADILNGECQCDNCLEDGNEEGTDE